VDSWYLTGLCEGCASFTYSRSGTQVSLYFALSLPLEDLGLLEEIQRFLDGTGRIYEANRRACFRVTHRDELPRIVSHFDSYPLRTRKRDSYEIWREMVQIKQQFRRPDRQALSELAIRLSNRQGHSER